MPVKEIPFYYANSARWCRVVSCMFSTLKMWKSSIFVVGDRILAHLFVCESNFFLHSSHSNYVYLYLMTESIMDLINVSFPFLFLSCFIWIQKFMKFIWGVHYLLFFFLPSSFLSCFPAVIIPPVFTKIC